MLRYFQHVSAEERILVEVNEADEAVRQLDVLRDGTVRAYTADAWEDEHGSLVTRAWVREVLLEPLTAREFERRWRACTPTNHPVIRRDDPPVPATAADLHNIVEEQLQRIPWPEAVAHIRALLLSPPLLQLRRWDRGRAQEFPCWRVLEWPERGLGVVYCAYGHRYDWGCVELDSPWMGDAEHWQGNLLKAMVGLGLYDGRPEGYGVWLRRQPVWSGGRLRARV